MKHLTTNVALLATLLGGSILSRAQNTFPSSGNVGIGTSTPQTTLHVKGIPRFGVYDNIYLQITESFGPRLDFFRQSADGNGALQFRSSTDGVNYSERMRIADNGNVGIGNWGGNGSLTSTLNVSGTGRFTSNLTAGGSITATGSVTGGSVTTGAYYYSSLNSSMIIRTQGAGNMHFDCAGPFYFRNQAGTSNLVTIGQAGTISAIGNISTTGSISAGSTGSITTGAYYYSSLNSSMIIRTQGAGNMHFDCGGQFYFRNQAGTTNLVSISQTGNVGIGVSATSFKLDVNGNTRTKEVIVDVTTPRDLVFQDDFDLPSLDYVAQYITKHKHLPGIASGEQMQKDGLALSEHSMDVLQKVEELTLYIIEQNRKIKSLEEKIEILSNQRKN